MRTLPQLATRRAEVESEIVTILSASALVVNDAGRATRARALSSLHCTLMDVLIEAERVAYGEPGLCDLGVPQAFRWAVTGARLSAEHWSASAAEWDALADGPASR